MSSASVRLAFFCCFLSVFGVAQVSSWSYSEVNEWHTKYPSHCNGQKQSPIDLVSSKVVYNESYTSDPFSFTNFDTVTGIKWTLKNNGHTAQVTYAGTAVTMKGGALPHTYRVAQFHFHWGNDNTKGSEHTVDGIAYPMELHIVTFNTNYASLTDALGHDDGAAVLGFFFEIGAEHSAMAKIVSALTQVTSADTNTTTTTVFALNALMATTQRFYRYSGSLTTPNCNEVVTWTIFTDTIKISQAQMNAFRALQDSHNHILQNNYRPVQSLHTRTITSSFKPSAAPGTLAVSSLMLSAALLLSLRVLQ